MRGFCNVANIIIWALPARLPQLGRMTCREVGICQHSIAPLPPQVVESSTLAVAFCPAIGTYRSLFFFRNRRSFSSLQTTNEINFGQLRYTIRFCFFFFNWKYNIYRYVPCIDYRSIYIYFIEFLVAEETKLFCNECAMITLRFCSFEPKLSVFDNSLGSNIDQFNRYFVAN